MANRCPDCNKFVSLEHGEPEVGDLSIENNGEISAEVRLHLDCMDCGSELGEAYIEVAETNANVNDHIIEHINAEEDYSLEIEENETNADDRYNTIDKHGNPIKSMRYQTHYYGFTLAATVTCSCGEDFEIELAGEEQASGFEQLY